MVRIYCTVVVLWSWNIALLWGFGHCILPCVGALSQFFAQLGALVTVFLGFGHCMLPCSEALVTAYCPVVGLLSQYIALW